MRDRLYLESIIVDQSSELILKKNKIAKNPYFDLVPISSLRMRCEIAGFIAHRSRKIGLQTLIQDKNLLNRIIRFLGEQKNIVSLRDKPAEIWIRELKKWMLSNGYPLTYHARQKNGYEYQAKAKTLTYFEWILQYLEPEDVRAEYEKDIWELEKLDVAYRVSPIVNIRTINFTKIIQEDIRKEVKRTVYHLIQHEDVGRIRRKMTILHEFSKYLKENHPMIHSFREVDRSLIEEYLFYVNVELASVNNLAGKLGDLKIILEEIGKINGYDQLIGIILQREVPKRIKAIYRAYSDAELVRLNAAIAELDEQIARLLVIHQMLGTRISDTLTLERGCLYEKNGEIIIRIKQLKTRPYEKPVSTELATLIRKAEEYTYGRYGETKYIFVSEKDISMPMQYSAIRYKMRVMIYQKDLRDDNGERFGFGSHLFRHTYGKKLTEMHLDDWTIAKLLGHSSLGSVKHYRRMSNQVLAEETREVRRKMSEIILASLDGWEEEYEQIRYNGSI